MSDRDIAEDPSEAETRAVVGPRADFYLRTWQATERGGFNWAAFLFSGLWMPYRKMYRATSILYGIIIAETVAEELVFVWWLGMPETPRAVERGVTVAVCWMCGGFGNSWYLAHVRRAVASARANVVDEAERLRWLERRGGTSVRAAIGFFVLLLAGLLASLLPLELALGRG
jgi:hypothetical protein